MIMNAQSLLDSNIIAQLISSYPDIMAHSFRFDDRNAYGIKVGKNHGGEMRVLLRDISRWDMVDLSMLRHRLLVMIRIVRNNPKNPDRLPR